MTVQTAFPKDSTSDNKKTRRGLPLRGQNEPRRGVCTRLQPTPLSLNPKRPTQDLIRSATPCTRLPVLGSSGFIPAVCGDPPAPQSGSEEDFKLKACEMQKKQKAALSELPLPAHRHKLQRARLLPPASRRRVSLVGRKTGSAHTGINTLHHRPPPFF